MSLHLETDKEDRCKQPALRKSVSDSRRADPLYNFPALGELARWLQGR